MAAAAIGVTDVTAGAAMVAMAVMGVTQAAGGATVAGAMVAGVIRCRHQDVMANDVKVKVDKAVMVRRLNISRGTALPEYRALILAGSRDVR